MSKKVLKVNSCIAMTLFIIIVFFSIIMMIVTLSRPSIPNSWDGLGKLIILVSGIIICLLCIPTIIASISMIVYLSISNKKNRLLCLIFTIISIIIYGLILLYTMWSCISDMVNNYYNSSYILFIIIGIIFLLPNIINLIGLIKYKNGES